MAQLVVRNVENSVKERLQRRARRNGRSMEEEVRDILRAAVHKEESTPAGGLGTELAALFPKSGPDFVVEEFRGDDLEPPNFDE
ncbi:MAG TPA: Arc family DNA-binding protein [Candidatus Dormibacteraeota bacterium]|nr:Arc family DNA-binding protein [Candidatus Dormibacteraeota bacterium]